MNISVSLLLAGIILLGAIIFAECQNCSNYDVITDSRRTTTLEFNWDTDVPISDKNLDPKKWHRFRSYTGNKIPERPDGQSVEMNHCGTNYPMYISGENQHPTKDNEIRTATVKVSDWKAEIKIYQCPPDVDGESFYIYLLASAPADQTAYCAGEGEHCPPGYMHNGINCVDYFPRMIGPPIFSGPHTNGSNEYRQLYFTCEVQYKREPNDTFARFMTKFVFDGYELEGIAAPHKRLPPFTLEPDGNMTMTAYLTEYYLQGRLGKEIQCKVQSFWEGNHEKGPLMMSLEKYKATLEVNETYDFDFRNGSEQNITFTPTLPHTYFHCSSHKCARYPLIYLFSLNSSASADCVLRWSNGTDPVLSVYINPFVGSRIFQVVFKPYDGDFHEHNSSLWHNFIIPTVTIHAFESSELLCQSNSDPHITTFDGFYFDFLFSDFYYLVRGEHDKYKLEVQVAQEHCGTSAACNCGVIVREVNSVVKVMFDDCGHWNSITPRPISVTRLLEQYPDDGTEITRDETGRKFSVRMPSGTRVEMDATIPWLNIHVHLAPIYHGYTSLNSLCGNSNGDKDDDIGAIDPDFCRISDPEKNYFNFQPECYNEYFAAAKSCNCTIDQTTECTNDEPNITMTSPANSEMPTTWSSGVICIDPTTYIPIPHNNGGSDADYILDPADLFQTFVPDPNAGHNLNLSWPTPKNKTKEQVELHCLNLLSGSPVYDDCHAVANTNLTLLQCVSDIQIADEYIATTSYADSFGQECVNILIAQERAGGTPPAIDVSIIHSQICPAQCNGHGTCTNATCICNTGYIGADCSIDETQPPVLTRIVRSGICDIQQRPCATVSAFGYGFISSKTMKCRFSEMGGGSAMDNTGAFITSSEVSCSVPNITNERPAITRQGISVANKGILYSNVLEFVTFDSVCMECSQDKVCTQKTDACLISDRCYANGAMKDVHTCQQCSPSQSTSSWIEKPVADRLQPCSRTCDYGAQYKETICTANNAVVKAEPVLCQDSSCAAIPEENLQGVVMTISNEDTAKILLTPTNILSQVADVVNNYCSAHATQCCNSVGVPNGISLSSFTSLELCPYGSGYPHVGDTSSRIKVIVKMIPSQVQNECMKGAPQRSTDGEAAYADPDIIVTAVTEGKDAIEKALNITIVSVEKDDGSHSGLAGLPVVKPTLILVTTVTAFAMTRLF